MHFKLFLFAVLSFILHPSATPPAEQLNIKSSDDLFKTEMLNLVNQIRSEGCFCGRRYMAPVPPLIWDSKLEKASIAHAKDMNSNKFIGHRGSNGSKIGERIDKAEYNWKAVGENVSWGHRTVEAAVLGWKDSPGHCINIMNSEYKEMGAANEGRFWVQNFGCKMDEY